MAGRSGRTPGKGGFRQAATVLSRQVRAVGEARGFAVPKVLTHWNEIVGPELAKMTMPVDVRYGREGFGATLTVLTTGVAAPLVEMQKERMRERVNACYGYSAISRIRVTQTAATGFAEGQVAFERERREERPAQSEETVSKAEEMAADVEDERLRLALSRLAANILSRSPKGRKTP